MHNERPSIHDIPAVKLARFWRLLADELHTAPEFAEWPPEALDILAALLRAEAGPHGAH